MKKSIITATLLLLIVGMHAQPLSTGKKPVEPVYTMVEIHPEFPGGHEALAAFMKANLHYPAQELKNRTQGIVHFSYVVNEDGSTSNIKVIGTPLHGFTKEGIRLIKAMPKYKPAEENGKPVKSITTLNIKFELPEN